MCWNLHQHWGLNYILKVYMAKQKDRLRIIHKIGIMLGLYNPPQRNLKYRSISLLFFNWVLILLCATKLQAQASLQEITRFNIPVNEGFVRNVDAGGDINGDGTPDLVFGCKGGYNVFDATLYIYYSIPDSNSIPDQIINSPASISGGFGYSIAYAGDLNGDGISDLVVGIPYYGLIHQGAIAIYWGGNTLAEQPDVFIDGLPYGYTQSWDLGFGQNLITNCDVNGDGINDLLVYAEGPQYENWGNVYVFLGGNIFSTIPALHIWGSEIYEYLGINMQTGDINGDGFDDIILGNKRMINPQNSDLGYIYELKVYAGGISLSTNPVFESLITSDIDYWVSNIIANGDLNGDGYDDIIILHGYLYSSSLRIVYGQSEWSSLVPFDTTFQVSESFWLRSYCNLTNDPYSDFFVYSQFIPGTSDQFGCLCIYKQVSSVLDLNIDYLNSGENNFSCYGSGYQLGDMNHDGFNELFIYSGEHSIEEYTNYATILTEQYVGIQDEVLSIPDIRLECYPNPFRDAVTISLKAKSKGFRIENIKIYDLRGRLVYETNAPGYSSFRWDGKDKTSRLTSSGIYFVNFTDKDKKTLTTKVVRIR